MSGKKCIIIGAAGFIGSAITNEASTRGLDVAPVTRGNYDALRGTQADCLINAAGNSRKFVDTRDPVLGFEQTVNTTMRLMHDFSFKFFVHLSSGAVYPHEDDPAQNSEDTTLLPGEMSNYGFHKWLAERLALKYAPRHLILRMGGFVGPGLKKNAVFDLLSGAPLHVHPDSELQFMDTRDLAKALFDLISLPAQPTATNQIFNISARGTVTVRQIAQWAGKKIPDVAKTKLRIRAELNVDKITAILNLPRTDETLQAFIGDVAQGRIVLPAQL